MGSRSLDSLETEGINPRTQRMDRLPPGQLVALLHHESYSALDAVERILPEIGQAVERIEACLTAGGRLTYVGAGTSGRLGVLDASECPPTFGVPPELVLGIIAGGSAALTSAIEGAEDSPEHGAADLRARGCTPCDVVVGIAASGRTPYVVGALDEARTAGAYTIALANVSSPQIGAHAELTLAAVTGPEPLTGSTRLLAGTAQKLVLNLLTTATMVRLGKVYGNLMVDVRATNAKLRDRAARIVMAAGEVDRPNAEALLVETNGEARPAIVMARLGIGRQEAEALLAGAGGRIVTALGEDVPLEE